MGELGQELVGQDDILGHFCALVDQSVGPVDSVIQRSWRVPSAATSFFVRFYTSTPGLLLQHDPRVLMLSCIFLAAKVEENFVSVGELIEKINPKATQEAVLKGEAVVLEALHFDLQVVHVETCGYALLDSFVSVDAQAQSVSRQRMVEIRAGIATIVATQRAISLSEAGSMGTKSLILARAVAAVLHTVPEEDREDFRRHVQSGLPAPASAVKGEGGEASAAHLILQQAALVKAATDTALATRADGALEAARIKCVKQLNKQLSKASSWK